MSPVTDWRVYERRAQYLNARFGRLNAANWRHIARGEQLRHAAEAAVITRELAKCFEGWNALTRSTDAAAQVVA